MVSTRHCIAYVSAACRPAAVFFCASYPGSLKNGSGTRICPWIAMRTSSRVERAGSHPGPCHVPRRDRHTLPQLYRLGLNRTARGR